MCLLFITNKHAFNKIVAFKDITEEKF